MSAEDSPQSGDLLDLAVKLEQWREDHGMKPFLLRTQDATLEHAAAVIEDMVVTGRLRTNDEEIAAKALVAAAKKLRSLKTFQQPTAGDVPQ